MTIKVTQATKLPSIQTEQTVFQNEPVDLIATNKAKSPKSRMATKRVKVSSVISVPFVFQDAIIITQVVAIVKGCNRAILKVVVKKQMVYKYNFRTLHIPHLGVRPYMGVAYKKGLC